jgi:phytoene desaturase (3,4-didehydrolycopene-forming)
MVFDRNFIPQFYPVVNLRMISRKRLCYILACFSSSVHTFHIVNKLERISLVASSSPASSDCEAQLTRVIVVGGGVGGLAIASRIASSTPCEVTLLEKNSQVGGRCGSFDVDIPSVGTFRHEKGPSLLLLPHIYNEIFDDCGLGSSEDYGLVLKQCVPAYRVVFDDGESIDLGFPRTTSGDLNGFFRELEAESRKRMDSFEKDGAKKWEEYMKACEAFLDCGLPNFIEEQFNLTSFSPFIRESLREFGKAWPLKPHSDVLDAIFESNKMRALASFQDLYVGLQPYRKENLLLGGVLQSTAPAVFGLLAAIELHPTNTKCGVFAPLGGFRAVTRSLHKLAVDLKVDIKCKTIVTSVTKDGVYFFDETGRSNFQRADLIIVNADLPYAIKSLINHPVKEPARYDWADKYHFSSGVIAFHWSLNHSLKELNTHNVFLTASSRWGAKESWQAIGYNGNRNLDLIEKPFNFYVHRGSNTDPSAAPEGMDAIMVLVPCETLDRDELFASLPREEAIARYKNQFDAKFVSRVRDAVLHRMAVIESLRDMKSKILHEVVETPATYADQYNLGAGTPFALSHGLAQLSLMRPGLESSGLSNVLFCGASTRPGNGVPLVMIGAKLVAKKAVSKLKNVV